jgi:hypothetical protein
MRGTFGVHLARIAARFRFEVEDRLTTILRASAEGDSDGDDRPARRK